MAFSIGAIAASSVAKVLGKGLAIVVVIGGAYMAGKIKAASECREAQLRAELKEIKRQNKARDITLKRAEEKAVERSAHIEDLRKQVDNYEVAVKQSSNNPKYSLNDGDIERLRNIK